MEYKVPETFEWVPARAKCSAEQMFTLLGARIESDAVAMKEQLKNTNYQVGFKKVAADSFVVSKQYLESGFSFKGRNVLVKRTATGIAVDALDIQKESSPRPLFEASVSLGLDGICRYEFDGQPLELWQVSKKALEDLFFGGD